MKKLKLLPGAAGIIALTATIGFVDGRYETETESISRNRITPVMVPAHIADNSSQRGSDSDSPAYLVEFRRGDEVVKVLIDAENGQILLS